MVLNPRNDKEIAVILPEKSKKRKMIGPSECLTLNHVRYMGLWDVVKPRDDEDIATILP